MARSSILAGLPRFQRGGLWLFLIVVATSALLSDHPLAPQLLLDLLFPQELALWQPLTAVFLFPNGHLGGLLGTFLLQWFIGSHLEAKWGTARYLTFVLAPAMLGYLALALLSLAMPAAVAMPIGGTAPADVAAVVGFGVVFGRLPVQLFGALPVSARAFAGFMTALLVAGPMFAGLYTHAIPPAVAAALALGLALRWRTPPSSGKVAARKGGRKPSHLRVVPQSSQSSRPSGAGPGRPRDQLLN